jgi:hypothetical protein
MRKISFLILSLLFVFPTLAQSQIDRIFERVAPRLHSSDLRVLKLEMTPDPVREGQRVTFSATISNHSRHSGRVSLFVKDRDEVITEVEDLLLQPGQSRIEFPPTRYRFSRQEHCFTLEVDIERSRRPLDLAKEVCARRTHYGWSLAEPRIGPFYVEDLDMIPDPVNVGQEIRFRARIRNDGMPVRAGIRIQDRDQTVVQLAETYVAAGATDYYFPNTRYSFQRGDHCFTVIVDVERTPHRVDAAREFCAKPLGWTLRP